MGEYNGCAFNYAGSKARSLNDIYKILPEKDNLKVLDVFTGAASLATQLPSSWCITANDKERRLVEIHEAFQTEIKRGVPPEELLCFVKTYCHSFMKSDNKSCKKAHDNLKEDYNLQPTPLGLYALLCTSFSNQLRFNSKGEFNTPKGNRYFNPNMEKKLLGYFELLKDKNITFTSKDFREFEFGDYDLVISDSPYLKTTAGYNENGSWTLTDSVNLMSKLDKYSDNGGKFIMFEESWSKGVPNTMILEWASKFNMKQLGDNSNKCNYQRNNKKTQEIIIYNY